MPRRKLFPLRRCPGLVPIPEVDREIVLVVVDRPPGSARTTLLGHVELPTVVSDADSAPTNSCGAGTSSAPAT